MDTNNFQILYKYSNTFGNLKVCYTDTEKEALNIIRELKNSNHIVVSAFELEYKSVYQVDGFKK